MEPWEEERRYDIGQRFKRLEACQPCIRGHLGWKRWQGEKKGGKLDISCFACNFIPEEKFGSIIFIHAKSSYFYIPDRRIFRCFEEKWKIILYWNSLRKITDVNFYPYVSNVRLGFSWNRNSRKKIETNKKRQEGSLTSVSKEESQLASHYRLFENLLQRLHNSWTWKPCHCINPKIPIPHSHNIRRITKENFPRKFFLLLAKETMKWSK